MQNETSKHKLLVAMPSRSHADKNVLILLFILEEFYYCLCWLLIVLIATESGIQHIGMWQNQNVNGMDCFHSVKLDVQCPHMEEISLNA